jgi:2',3'-cyclic-nucleotide 2'-phosphodiesterase/3'-nucleotidase
VNSYRFSGAGGYPLYASCPVLSEQNREIVEIIMDYVGSHERISIDKTKWLTVLS